MKGNLAPIALFVYNRLEHTKKTLETLKRNILAEKSELYVFSDGLKRKKDEKKLEKLEITYRQLKEGGILAGHYVYWRKNIPVFRAVRGFVEKNNLNLRVLGEDW
jgi:hypothetical protein